MAWARAAGYGMGYEWADDSYGGVWGSGKSGKGSKGGKYPKGGGLGSLGPYEVNFKGSKGGKKPKGGKFHQPSPEAEQDVGEKIFVGSLPKTATAEEIWEYFSETFGPVADVELKMGPDGLSRGFAFVTFESVESAQAVIDNRADNMYDGKWIDCKPAVWEERDGKAKGKGGFGKSWHKAGAESMPSAVCDTPKIFVGSLPKYLTAEQIGEHFGEFGPVMNVELKADTMGNSRGFAFVTFQSIETAQAVVDNRADNSFDGSWIDCKPAVWEDRDAKGSGKVTQQPIAPGTVCETSKIFAGCLPKALTAEEVGEHFASNFGPVIDVDVKTDQMGISRGFAFVTFESVESAQAVIDNRIDNMICDTWIDCKPAEDKPDKGKGKGKGKGKWAEEPWPWQQPAPAVCETPKIFAGSLPKTATEEEIGEWFQSTYGPVAHVELKTDTMGNSRGFAFVTFESLETAQAVIDNRADNVFQGVPGQWIDCKPADDSKGKGKGKDKDKGRSDWNVEAPAPVTEKIFVGNLPEASTEDTVNFHFAQFGGVKKVELKKGFAFVTFESKEDAQLALDTPDALDFEGSKLDVKPAREAAPKGKGVEKGWVDKGTGKGKGKGWRDSLAAKLYVGCIPFMVSEQEVQQYFEYFGPVKEVTLDFDELGLSRGSGHVTFHHEEIAQSILAKYSDDNFDPVEWAPGILLDIKQAEAPAKIDIPVTEKVFVGGLPRDCTAQLVQQHYSKFGPLNIKDITLKFNSSDSQFKGHAFIAFQDVESAQKAIDGATFGWCRPAKPLGMGNSPAPPTGLAPTGNVLKINGLPNDPKARDVFRFFYSYSTTRIRDTGQDIFIEFSTEAECKKAFKEKAGHKLGAHVAHIAGATQEELALAASVMAQTQEPQTKGVKGGYGPTPAFSKVREILEGPGNVPYGYT